jgi:hypothetical protein
MDFAAAMSDLNIMAYDGSAILSRDLPRAGSVGALPGKADMGIS